MPYFCNARELVREGELGGLPDGLPGPPDAPPSPLLCPRYRAALWLLVISGLLIGESSGGGGLLRPPSSPPGDAVERSRLIRPSTGPLGRADFR